MGRRTRRVRTRGRAAGATAAGAALRQARETDAGSARSGSAARSEPRACAAAGRSGRRAVASAFALLAAVLAAAALAEPPPPPPGAAGAGSADLGDAAAIASLRAALAALAAGDRERGVSLLAAVEDRHPIVSDHAALLAARAELEAARFDDCIAIVKRFFARGVPTPLASDLARAQAEAELGKGDPAAARASFLRALDAAEDPGRTAPLLRSLAELEAEAGDPEAAAAHWLRLWRDLPAQAAARGSGEKLETLARGLGRAPFSADDARTRGDRLFDAGLREASVDAYDLALARGVEGEARAHAQRRRGEALFGLRRYAQAQAAFAALGDDAEAEVYAARAVARGGDVEGGVASLLAQSEKRPGAPGAQARWYAALLLDGENETARARPLFDAVARDAADPALRAGAQWRLGWADYRAGRFADARRRFEQMGAAAQDAVAKLQARYWAARAGERGGQGDAERDLTALVRDAPLSYYGWRAREWLAKRGALPRPSGARSPIATGEPALGPRDAARAHILVQAGLGGVATEEIDRLAARAGDVSDTLLVAGLYQEAGAWDRALGVVVKRHADALPLGVAEGQEGLWRAAWPRAFGDAVRRGSTDGGRVDRPLLWALMREESSFRPAVLSPAGAVGLLQLMPETAARVAGQLGFAGYRDALLTDPATNIRLGAAYLGTLFDRFGGRASAAVGSYNAGPAAVERWLAEHSAQADDEWVETVPYDETRNYIKRVLRSRHAYRELYADER